MFSEQRLRYVVRDALDEDLGAGDATTQATVPDGLQARATIRQKADGVLSGIAAAECAFRLLDSSVSTIRASTEGT